MRSEVEVRVRLPGQEVVREPQLLAAETDRAVGDRGGGERWRLGHAPIIADRALDRGRRSRPARQEPVQAR